MMIRTRSLLAPLALLATLGACVSDDVVGLPAGSSAGSFTVNASTDTQYVSLGDSALVTPTPSASESAAWDLAFFATSVTLNGGSAGPAGVTAVCLCQNAAATGDEVLAMTAESERPDFDAVTSVPAGLTWTTDAFVTHRYYRYNIAGDHRISPTFDVYLLRRGATTYKLQIIGYYGPTGTSRQVSFRWARLD